MEPVYPLGGAGAHAIHQYDGRPDPGLYNAIATGAPLWRGEAPGASAFLATEREHFFDLNFGILC
jgi:hypothetical protein